MIAKAVLGVLLASSTAAVCAYRSVAEGEVLTMDQYLAQCSKLLGKPVRVGGYIGVCGGYDCMLFRDEAGRHAMDASLRSPTRDPGPPWVGIGYDEAFDRKASGFQNSYVVIAGVVDKESCTGAGGLDRVEGIVPQDIRSWPAAERRGLASDKR